MDPEALRAFAQLVAALEEIGVLYAVSGSVAGSAHGAPRSTRDADLIADIRPEHIAPLVARLSDDFYIDAEMIADAIARRASFNVIHYDSSFKIDIFVQAPATARSAELARRQRGSVNGLPVYLVSPEDLILAKLDWFRQGGEVSEVQWRDVLGVIDVQGEALDRAYLRDQAEQRGLADLLEKALV